MRHSIRTDADVRRAPPPVDTDRAQYRVEGVTGLWLRVTRKGVRTWRLESRAVGRKTLGTYPSVGLADAKAAALQLLGDAERARVNRKVGHVLRTTDRRTLADVLDGYGAARGARLASWADQRKAIEHHFGDLIDKPVERATAEAILDHVESVRSVGAKRAAIYLNAVLRHAGIAETVGGRELDDIVPESARTRVLDDHELRAVLSAADGLDPLWRDFTRASLLLIARRGDIAKMRPEHLDLAAGIWSARIHKVRGHGHRVERMPLSRASVDLLTARLEPGATFLFEPSKGEHLRHNFDRTLKRLHRLSGVAKWTWHDLRRTGRTLMSRSGIRPDIAERCMSHAIGRGDEMVRTYDQYDFEPEMRAAFEAIASAVEDIKAGRPLSRKV
jgi:hypothetical protein